MDSCFKISLPFFELRPKVNLYGQQTIDLALFVDEISEKFQVDIIFSPHQVDIYPVVQTTKNLQVYAQHMDLVTSGKGISSVLPEVVKRAGAHGVLLNHAERPLTLAQLQNAVLQADEVGLAEKPELIGTGKRDKEDLLIIKVINQTVWQINAQIMVLDYT